MNAVSAVHTESNALNGDTKPEKSVFRRQWRVKRREVTERTTTNEGIVHRMNPSIQVEGAFGVLKKDYAFQRFLTRGKRKTETQFFLLRFAFNIQKLWNRSNSGPFGKPLFEKIIA